MDYLPDVLVISGLGLMATGVALVFGFEWALVLTGFALLAIGMAATWRRNR